MSVESPEGYNQDGCPKFAAPEDLPKEDPKYAQSKKEPPEDILRGQPEQGILKDIYGESMEVPDEGNFAAVAEA
ncbi:O-glycoside alpha-1,2-mannosyltransferase 4, partial [Elasticomyces elasticus]